MTTSSVEYMDLFVTAETTQIPRAGILAGPPDQEPLIALAAVEKTYPARGNNASVAALHDVTLEVPKGAILGVIGRSGAGKSTLIRLVNGLERPTRGSVLVDGVDMAALGIYSEKIDSIDALPDGGTIGIPNDPTNGGRVLLLLEDNDILDLTDGIGTSASVADIIDNPKNLQIVEIDAAQLPRALPDVDAAGINTNYAEEAGLDPVNDPILRESPKGPYVNVIAVRTEDKDEPWVAALVEAYQSDEIKQFVETTFNGAVLASW